MPALDWTEFLSALQGHAPLVCAGVAVLSYLVLVRSLRWRRYHAIHRKYEDKWKKGSLTVAEAQEIIHVSTFYDMPTLMNKALAFALFKTYTIPRTSELLLSTRQLTSTENVAKRYADTEILISTWVGCPITGFTGDPATTVPDPSKPAEDPRAALAIARVNFLHSKYKIDNDDFLDTLCLFVLEPATWADKWGWRSLSPMEKDAFFVFWLDVGGKMGIEGIPESLEALKAWSEAFQEVHTAPHQVNNEVAGYTIGELLCAVPRRFGLRSFAERMAICVLEERVRKAMLLPEQPRVLHWLLSGIMTSAWVTQRFLLLPRRSSNFLFPIDPRLPTPDENGEMRQRPTEYRSIPWYKAEPKGLFSGAMSKLAVQVGYHTDVPAPKFFSQGYLIDRLGPERFEHAGHTEVLKSAARLQGCPIAAPWAPTTVVQEDILVSVD